MDKSFLQNIFIPILAVFLSVTTFQVFADGDEDDDQKHRWSPAQVVITKVFSDTDVGELYIHGQEFESRWGSTPIVTLAQTRQTPGFELQVQSFTDNLIVAWLPPAIEAGDYLLEVKVARHFKWKKTRYKADSFDLTIGAVGPQGDKGDTGATGLQGPQGEQGLKGDNGATGPSGPQDPQGPQGPIGFTGATGSQGPKGDTGAAGPQGPQGPRDPLGPQGPAGPAGSSITVSLGNTVTTSSAGGSGGSPFNINCPADQVVVGMNVRSGGNIDRINLRCAPITGIGAGAYTLFANTGSVSISAGAGGTGGASAVLSCPSTYALRGISGRVGNLGNGLVDQIRGECRKLLSSATSQTATRGAVFPNSVTFSLICPDDKVMTGLRGGAGNLIDRVQAVCR